MRPFRLLPVLLAVALASCEGGGPNGGGLPPLREGFTYLKRVGGVVRNAAMEGFNTDAVGLAVSGDGSRVAALVMAGQFFQTFTTTTVYDWGSGSYRTELGGGTSTNTWFTFHLSEDGGATWRELPLRPAMGAPTGWTSGLVLAGDRAFTVVEGPSGWHVVEIDTETGIYRPVEVRYPDGNLWAPLIYHARAFSGSIVSVHVPLDTGYVAAWRGNLATGEASVYRDDDPACIPMGVTNGQRPELFVPTSASTIQGICKNRRDEVCWFTWDLRDDAPFTTPLQIVRCAPGDEFTHPSSLAIEGVVPEFTPVAALPTAGGLHVVGRAVYATEGHERVWTHAVALSFREDGGPPYTVDLGPGDIIENDFRFLRPQRGGFALVTPDCGERPTDGTTGACIGESLPGAGFDRPTLVGWDPSASAFGPVSLSPSPCVDPNACFAVPDRLVPAGDGRYLATFRVHTGGLHGAIERGLAIGFVYAPWYEPPASLEPEPATPLEMRCWAELECDPISRLQPTGTLLERVRTCIERWRLTRGAPDAHWERFIGTALDDCDGLRAADPVGFVDPAACLPGDCDPSGEVACNWMRSCEEANGGACSVVGGVGGCFADACPDGPTGEPHCDAAGRWVDCPSGMVDDCAAHGLVCVERNGCMVPDARCTDAIAQFCDGDTVVYCRGSGIASRVDCTREGLRCEARDGYVNCSPPPYSTDPPRCEGERLIVDGRAIDCGALGMTCWASAEAGYGLCDPSR